MYKLGQFIVNRLPLNVSYKFANIVSDLHYIFSFRDRRAVRRNLSCILPSSENLPALTREVFRNFGLYLTEFFQMKKILDADFIKQKIRIQNIGYFEEALRHGKGAIVLTAHLGNWELGAGMMGILGYPIKVIALSHKERPVNDLFNQQREAKGVGVIPTHVAMDQCMEDLKNNKLIAIAADRDFSLKGGEVMDFLGKKAVFPRGAAIFSARTQAPIIPTFLVRAGEGFTFLICDPIYPPQGVPMSRKEVILDIMKRYIAVIEEKIRQYPTQWLVFREFCVPS